MSGQQQITLAREFVVSPSELMLDFIKQYANTDLMPGGAVIGGASDSQQQQGCVALMDAGHTKMDESGHLLHKRIQVRAMGPSLAVADDIGNHLFDLIDAQDNRLVLEDSRGKLWLVHGMSAVAGTSHHIDSSETWENLFFASITVGRDSVGTAD